MIDVVLDISHWQRITNSVQVKEAGIVGIIHKATESKSYVDPMFTSRRITLSEKFLFGSYHFLRRDGKGEADFYLDRVKPTEGELIMLDTESQQLSDEGNIAESEAFVYRVHELTGRYPVWYIGNYLLNAHKDYTGSILLNCPLFVARYSSKEPTIPPPFKTWTLWQYTQDGAVDGITTVDRDRFNGDMDGLLKLWNQRADSLGGVNIDVSNDKPDNG